MTTSAGGVFAVGTLLGACTSGQPVASADWYGEIAAVSTFAYRINTAAGVMLQQEGRQIVTLTTSVTQDGARTAKIAVTSYSYNVGDIIVDGCDIQHGTSLSTATVPETESDAAPASMLPPDVQIPGIPHGGYFSVRVDDGVRYAFVEGVGPSFTGLVGATAGVVHTDNFVAYSDCAEVGVIVTSENDLPASFMSSVPLDRLQGQLSADGKTASGHDAWRDGDYYDYTLSWSLKKTKDLDADVGGPYSVERGTTITLDGSQSRGAIDEYVWTLTPGADCKDNTTDIGLEVGHQAETKGKTYTFTALCSVDIRLVVHGHDGAEDADIGRVTVEPRIWKTRYTPPEVAHVDIDRLRGGTNQCAFESVTAVSGHYIHRTPGEPGYALKQVDDPDGPFAHAFYLVSPDLKVGRREVLETAYMADAGDIFVGTGAPFNALLQSEISDHESAHSALIEAALKRDNGKRDPAQLIEAMASDDETRLRGAADVSITTSDHVLCEATQHPFVFAKLMKYAGKSGVVKTKSGEVIATVPNLQVLANEDVRCP